MFIRDGISRSDEGQARQPRGVSNCETTLRDASTTARGSRNRPTSADWLMMGRRAPARRHEKKSRVKTATRKLRLPAARRFTKAGLRFRALTSRATRRWPRNPAATAPASASRARQYPERRLSGKDSCCKNSSFPIYPGPRLRAGAPYRDDDLRYERRDHDDADVDGAPSPRSLSPSSMPDAAYHRPRSPILRSPPSTVTQGAKNVLSADDADKARLLATGLSHPRSMSVRSRASARCFLALRKHDGSEEAPLLRFAVVLTSAGSTDTFERLWGQAGVGFASSRAVAFARTRNSTFNAFRSHPPGGITPAVACVPRACPQRVYDSEKSRRFPGFRTICI